MLCRKCGYSSNEGERFCRKCGAVLDNSALAVTETAKHLSHAPSKDPDELTGNGIGSVFVGDGFLIVAVILAATSTAISSLVWLLLLIPAFFFFGKGFADLLHAQQIRRRMKLQPSNAPDQSTESVAPTSVVDVLNNSVSGELALPSITERTTRDLK